MVQAGRDLKDHDAPSLPHHRQGHQPPLFMLDHAAQFYLKAGCDLPVISPLRSCTLRWVALR